jgi:hypothetical protein
VFVRVALTTICLPFGKPTIRPSEEFYSLFYLGLFNEARGEASKAENYMKSAVKSTYAKAVGSRDYMVDCAKVRFDSCMLFPNDFENK